MDFSQDAKMGGIVNGGTLNVRNGTLCVFNLNNNQGLLTVDGILNIFTNFTWTGGSISQYSNTGEINSYGSSVAQGKEPKFLRIFSE